MIILKYNALSVEDLFSVERQLLRWLDHKENNVGLDFDVLTLGRTDIYGHLLGIFTQLGCTDTLNITHSDLLDFFIDVDAAYLNAPYHSFYHAVDIVFMIYYLLTELGAKAYMPPLDITALLIAGLCHDIGHPGYNNVYQTNFGTDLAKKYNNISVLEALSSEMTQSLILDKHINIVNSLMPEYARNEWLDKIGKMIMYTDMVHHYTLQEQAGLLEDHFYRSGLEHQSYDISCQSSSNTTFANEKSTCGQGNDDYFSRLESHPPPYAFSTSSSQWSTHFNNGGFAFSPQCYYPTTPEDDDDDDNESNTTDSSTSITTSTNDTDSKNNIIKNTNISLDDHQRLQLSAILLHAADISNTVRPWNISKQWSDLIVQEFFHQGDIEKERGMAVSPGMDRDLSTQPDISLTFGDLVVKPYFEALTNLLPGAQVLLDVLECNRAEWIRIKQDQGYGADICNGNDNNDGLLQSLQQQHQYQCQYQQQQQQRQFPSSLLPIPETTIQPPIERRVSVAAGTLVIPENVGYSSNGSIRCRTGLRSQSFAMERSSLSRKLSYGPIPQRRSTTLPSKVGLASASIDSLTFSPLSPTPSSTSSLPIKKQQHSSNSSSPIYISLNFLLFILLYLSTNYPILSFVYMIVTTSYLIF
ncbi:unnamed protein product [Absidia cylindrospora]